MKRIAIGAFIATIFGILILSCGPYPPSYSQSVDLYIKYENIASVEGGEITVQWINTRTDKAMNLPPLSVLNETTLTPDNSVYSPAISFSDGFDKNYIDVVGIRRDSIHNWFVHFEEVGRNKPPKLVYLYYYFNGVRYTKPDTITIDLASK